MTVMDIVAYELERTAEFVASMTEFYPNSEQVVIEISLIIRRRAEFLRKQDVS